MITFDDVKKISHKISLENGISDNDLSEDVSEIVYRIDVFECDDAPIIDRHIESNILLATITKFMKRTLSFNLFVHCAAYH